MTGFKTVAAMVSAMVDSMGITVPVALHLDHGTYEGCKACVEAVSYTHLDVYKRQFQGKAQAALVQSRLFGLAPRALLGHRYLAGCPVPPV